MQEIEVPVKVLDFIEGRCYNYEKFKDPKDDRMHLIIKIEDESFKLFNYLTTGAKRSQAPA